MIAFRDFVPKVTDPGGFFKSTEFETFEAAVAAANEWLQQKPVKIINVETVVLPEIWNPSEEGTRDAALRTSGEMSSYWHQFVRVWYETG